MGSPSRKIRRAQAAKDRKSQPDSPLRRIFPPSPERAKPAVTEKGLFCDCYGTLYSHSFTRSELLVNYLNAQHAAGREVRLISTNVMESYKHIRDIGLHPDIARSLINKTHLHNRVLEELIDDDPVGLTAATLHNPKDESFRQHMRDFLAKNPAPAPAPSPI